MESRGNGDEPAQPRDTRVVAVGCGSSHTIALLGKNFIYRSNGLACTNIEIGSGAPASVWERYSRAEFSSCLNALKLAALGSIFKHFYLSCAQIAGASAHFLKL